eukprot:6374719-Alexandrium_andersonii.AAC.1
MTPNTSMCSDWTRPAKRDISLRTIWWSSTVDVEQLIRVHRAEQSGARRSCSKRCGACKKLVQTAPDVGGGTMYTNT